MPIYKFKCPECEYTEERLSSHMKDLVMNCPSCESEMQRLIPTPSQPIIYERLDSLRNKQIKKNTDQNMKGRSKKHFVQVDLPELVEKYGEKYSKEQGWLNDKGQVKKFGDYK
jgi:putative FmdB family regulatory protein